MLPLWRDKLPVIPTEPVMYISLFAIPERASIIRDKFSARITLPLCMPDVLIVLAIYL